MKNLTGYDSIAGYKEIKSRLKNSIKKNRISHSYIFSGEAGSGKTVLAALFAEALLCFEQTGDPCMVCSSCKKVQSGNHPDIIVVLHDKPESISVGDIRRQLVEDIHIRPFESKYKIYLIPDASMMTMQAQNALLKTLEDPPKYAVIILLADNMEALLPTVVSRCATVKLNPLSDEIVKEYLEKEMMVPENYASVYAALAMGKIGVAKKLASSDGVMAKIQECLAYLKKSKDIDSLCRIEINKKFIANKKEIRDYLDIFTIWFRDVLLFKATRETENLVIKEELSSIKKRAAVSSYEGIQTILDAIDTARVRLKANVNPEIVMELLLLTISEN